MIEKTLLPTPIDGCGALLLLVISGDCASAAAPAKPFARVADARVERVWRVPGAVEGRLHEHDYLVLDLVGWRNSEPR